MTVRYDYEFRDALAKAFVALKDPHTVYRKPGCFSFYYAQPFFLGARKHGNSVQIYIIETIFDLNDSFDVVVLLLLSLVSQELIITLFRGIQRTTSHSLEWILVSMSDSLWRRSMVDLHWRRCWRSPPVKLFTLKTMEPSSIT